MIYLLKNSLLMNELQSLFCFESIKNLAFNTKTNKIKIMFYPMNKEHNYEIFLSFVALLTQNYT